MSTPVQEKVTPSPRIEVEAIDTKPILEASLATPPKEVILDSKGVEEPMQVVSNENEEPEKEVEKEQEKIAEAQVETSEEPKLKKSNVQSIPSLASIEDLIKETEEELGQKPPEKLPLNIEKVMEVWESHKALLESPSSKATMENTFVSIENESIMVVVPSSVSKEEINQQVDLYQKLRNAFNNNELNVIIDVDRSRFPDLADNSTIRMYTMKEKFDYLAEKNPELNNLVKVLNLKVDQE